MRDHPKRSSHSLSLSLIWYSIRSKSTHVSWHMLIWHKLQVLRFSFIMWMTTLQKLSIFDRIAKYSHIVDLRCCLCTFYNENHAHLLFECEYSRSILFILSIIEAGLMCLPTDMLCLFGLLVIQQKEFTSLF